MLGMLMVAGTCHLGAQEKATGIPAGGRTDLIGLHYGPEGFIFQAAINTLYVERSGMPSPALHLSLPGYLSTGNEAGHPALPVKSILLEAHGGNDLRVRITEMDSMVIDLRQHGFEEQIAPWEPSPRKGTIPAEPLANHEIYGVDAWVGPPLLTVDYGGIMRGLPVSTLYFSPFRYHPRKHQIKVYYNVRAVIDAGGPSGGPEIPSLAFSSVFERIVLQRSEQVKKAVFAEEPMTMVILSDSMFRQTLHPFVKWKTEKGFRVVEAYVQDPAVGVTRESIKAYLEGMYTSPPSGIAPLTYLLIVGDVEQVPLSQSGGEITDLYYATYDGAEDYIPDVFYGRISVALPDQLQAVLDKILEYEQYRFPDPAFLNEAVLIAGVDGTFAARHGNGQINYARKLYFNASNGINAHAFLYPGSDTSDRVILDLISRGAGFVNYTGHGLYDRWINPTFHQDDIAGLMNTGKYPVMIGNGCETNIYTLGTCFAEALVRTPGRGALAYIGCTSDSYWDEDYYWSVGVGPIVSDPQYEQTSMGYYDRVFHQHAEPRESWTPSLGEMIFGGNLAVQESHSSRKKFYWEIYQLMGDPSLVPWFGLPGTREIHYPELLPPASERLDISCAPYDYIALSRDGQLLDAAHAGPLGSVTLQLPGMAPGDSLSLVVTGDRHVPFRGSVVAGNPDLPYLDLLHDELSAESREADHLVSHEEFFSLDLVLVNRGQDMPEGDTLVLRTYHPGITITDSLVRIEPLAAGESVTLRQAFGIRSGKDVRDRESFTLVMQTRGDPSGRRTFLNKTVHAPLLVSGGIRWDDRPYGNGNGIAEGGERLVCEWDLSNAGHFRTEAVTGMHVAPDPSIFGELGFPVLTSLEAGAQCTYRFTADPAVSLKGVMVAGPFLAGDGYTSVRDSFTLVPGRHFEDFGQAAGSRYPFVHDPASPWRTDPGTYASSPSSLRSGPIPDLGNSQLTIRFETGQTDTLFFSFRVSSETGYDFLVFYADSVEVDRWSGEREWASCAHVLEPGNHEITWSYRKDQSISRGADAAWIDDVIFPSQAFRQQDLSLVDILNPRSGPWLTGNETVALLVRNTGNETVTELSTRILVEGRTAHQDRFGISLLPGGEMVIQPEGSFDFEGFGDYTIHAEVFMEGDRYPGNNRIVRKVSHHKFPDLGMSLREIDRADGVFTDAVITLENLGNTRLDSIPYEIMIDGVVTDSGVRPLGLEPGRTAEMTFRLIDSLTGEIHSGVHDFMIRSTMQDSVSINDQVSGTLYWHAAGTGGDRQPAGFSLYPNPSAGGFFLVLAEPSDADLSLFLFHASGKIMGRYVIRRGEDRLYLGAGLAPGHYLLECPEKGITLHLVKPR